MTINVAKERLGTQRESFEQVDYSRVLNSALREELEKFELAIARLKDSRIRVNYVKGHQVLCKAFGCNSQELGKVVDEVIILRIIDPIVESVKRAQGPQFDLYFDPDRLRVLRAYAWVKSLGAQLTQRSIAPALIVAEVKKDLGDHPLSKRMCSPLYARVTRS